MLDVVSPTWKKTLKSITINVKYQNHYETQDRVSWEKIKGRIKVVSHALCVCALSCTISNRYHSVSILLRLVFFSTIFVSIVAVFVSKFAYGNIFLLCDPAALRKFRIELEISARQLISRRYFSPCDNSLRKRSKRNVYERKRCRCNHSSKNKQIDFVYRKTLIECLSWCTQSL